MRTRPTRFSTVADMPAPYQALHVVAVMNTPGAFGDYSHPIKLYAAMACGRPVVASRTASTAWVLRDFPDRLVAPGDAAALAGALVSALDLGAVDLWSAAGLDRVGRGVGGGDAADWRAVRLKPDPPRQHTSLDAAQRNPG